MGTILWIDQNTFASNLVEKAAKKKGVSFYTLAAAKDFAYLVEDLTPSLIVIDVATAITTLTELRQEFESSSKFQKTPVILIGSSAELSFLSPVGEVKKPLDPFTVLEQIQKVLGTLN